MGRLNKQAFPTITVTIDLGGSGTKAIVQHFNGKPQLIYMEPQVIALPRSSLSKKTYSISSAAPENIAWIGIENKYCAVGYLAQLNDATNGLRYRKYELAIYKILAVIWVAAQRFNLPPQFDLSLALLLPPGEYEDSHLLLPSLQEALSKFDTSTGVMSIKLKNYSCFPEGGGLFMHYSQKHSDKFNRWNIAIVQLGYRNASVLMSYRGVLNKGTTANLGMSKMVDLVLERTSGLNPLYLLKAIVAAGREPKPRDFLPMISTFDLSHRFTHAERAALAVASARVEYIAKVINWLKQTLPPAHELSGIIFSGGTAEYLEKELDDVFGQLPLIWHGEVVVPAGIDSVRLGNRLADVWALSEYHNRIVKTEALETTKRQKQQQVS